MKTDGKKYESILKECIRDRFKNVSSVEVREIKEGYNSDTAIDWTYLGVENKSNFYLNGNKNLNIFFELEFLREEGLRERIAQSSKTGGEIDKASRFLARPHREYMDGRKKQLEKNSPFQEYVGDPKKIKVDSKKDYYFVCCRIKRIPANPRKLIDTIWGYLMSIPVGVTIGALK